MKNITLFADDVLIEKVLKEAAQQSTTLINLFREWPKYLASHNQAVSEYDELMKRLSYVRPGRKFTRT